MKPNICANLKFDNVSFSWPNGNKVINKCSFTIDKPGLWMLVGKNGSGKSTLFRLISGSIRPTNGQIFSSLKPSPLFFSSLVLLCSLPLLNNLFSSPLFSSLLFVSLACGPQSSSPSSSVWLRPLGELHSISTIATAAVQAQTENVLNRCGLFL